MGIAAVIAWGCGGAPTPAVVSGHESESESEVESEPDAVALRLAALPTPPIDWATPLLALDASSAAALCDYDRASIPPASAVSCAASTVRVGPGDACSWQVDDARAVGHDCALTVGDIAACRAAIRDNPCAQMGDGLPECVPLHQCLEQRFENASNWLDTSLRIVSRIRLR